ncbi:MAG: fused MFS/spermidine synthase [Coriobacteriia bacterium]|nr:fused MFS/spermidine synthase [Coriobacteriia bacterium]
MYEHDSEYHRLRVTENDGVRTLRFERNEQSSMRLDDPFETDIDYVGYLHLTMAVKPDAARTLVIGLGGGSLVKRMWRDYPAMRLDVAEIDPEVVEVARAFFALPDCERIRVVLGDGRAWLSTCSETYDIVVVDAFDDDRVPRRLLTEESMREAREHLAPDGVVAYNVIGSVYGPHSKPLRSLHRTASNVWRRVWTFPVGIAEDLSDAARNIILLASDSELTEDELLERIATRVDGLVTVPGFERFSEDLYQGKVRTGDVAIITDPPRDRRRSRRRS